MRQMVDYISNCAAFKFFYSTIRGRNAGVNISFTPNHEFFIPSISSAVEGPERNCEGMLCTSHPHTK